MVRPSRVKKGGSRNAPRGDQRLTTPESGRGRKEKDAMSSLLMLSDTDETGAQPESVFDRLKTPPNPPGLNKADPRTKNNGFSPLQDIPYSRSELIKHARSRGISAEGIFRDVRPSEFSRRPPRPPSILEGTKSQDIVSAPLVEEEEEEEISFRDFAPYEHTAAKVASGDKRGASVFPSIARETYQKPKPNEALAQESQLSISIPAPLVHAKQLRKGLAISKNVARPAPIDTRGSSTILDGGQMLALQPSTTSVGRDDSHNRLDISPQKTKHQSRSGQRDKAESPLPPIEHLTGTRLHFVEKEESDLKNRPPSVQESATQLSSLMRVVPPSPVYTTKKTFVVDPHYLEKTNTLTLDSSLLEKAAVASEALRGTDASGVPKPSGNVLSPSKSMLRSPISLKARSPQKTKEIRVPQNSVALPAGDVIFDAPVPPDQMHNLNATNNMPSTFGLKKPPAEPELLGTGIEIAAEVFDEEEDYDSDGSNPEDRGLRQLIAKHSQQSRIKRPKPRRIRGRKGHIMTSQFPRAGVSTSVMDPYVRTLNNKKKQFEETTFVAEIKNLREVMAQAQKFREDNRKLKMRRKSSSAVTGMNALGPEGMGLSPSASPDAGYKSVYENGMQQEMGEVYEQHVTFPMTPQ